MRQTAAQRGRAAALLLGLVPVAQLLAAGESPGTAPAATACRGVVPAAECRITEAEFGAAVTRWEDQLRERGRRLGERFTTTAIPALNTAPRAWYYDAQRVFLQAAEYLDDPDGRWDAYAQAAEAAYEAYVRPAYGVPGYERFPHGLALDHRRHGDPESLATLRGLRDRGPFADVLENPAAARWYQQAYSREIAYMIDTHVAAERSGLPPRPQALAQYVDMALTHVHIWTTGAYRTENPDWQFCQPFMAGLTASALIDYYRLTVDTDRADDRIPTELATLADWLIEHAWVPNHATELPSARRPRLYGSFRYVIPPKPNVGGDTPAPDLNLLIAPLFAWLYRETGEAGYRGVAEMAFIAGVHLGWLERPKTFNQHYRASFDLLRWRRDGLASWDDDTAPTAADLVPSP